MKNVKRFLATGIIAAVVMTSVGCGSRTQSAGDSANDTAGAVSETAADVIDIENDTIKVGVSLGSLDTNSSRWLEAIKAISVSYPNVEVTDFVASGAAETQVQQFQEMINQGYNLIYYNPLDISALENIINDAESKGVRVVSLVMAADVPQSIHFDYDSYGAGVLIAADMSERLEGKGKVVCINEPVEMANLLLTNEGLVDQIDEIDGMEVLEERAVASWSTEDAATIMRDYLSKYNNDIQAVFCCNDRLAFGAAQAIEAAGLEGKILIYATDGTQEAMEYIQQGKMTGSVYYDAEQVGNNAIQMGLFALETGVSAATTGKTNKIKVSGTLVTDVNVKDFIEK